MPSAFAAQCLDVFPAGWRQLTPVSEQLINFPTNNSSATLTAGTTLPRGDNFYNNSNVGNQDEVFVGAIVGSETTARLFFKSSVAWNNIKINESGNPEDLIIVIDASLQITGDNTVINAIIYVKGTMTVTGNVTINGAATVLGTADNFNVNYNASNITNADFNGMCAPLLSCEVFFPGASPLAAFGAIGTIDIKGSASCNGGNCSVASITQPRLPTIDTGGSNQGNFNLNSLSDQAYNYYTNWGSVTNVSYTDNSGTAVVYIQSFGNDVIIPENTNFNAGGSPSEVLLVIETDKKVEIGKDSTFNAFVYIVASEEIKLNTDIAFNGALTVVTDKLTVEEGDVLNYNVADLNGFNPQGFCSVTPPAAPALVAQYKMDEVSWGAVIDSVNGFNGTAFNGADIVGSTCRYGEFDGVDDYVQIPHDNALNGSNALTYMAYIRADMWTGVDQIMAKSVHGGGSGRAQMGIFSENGVFKVRAETVNVREEINDTLPVTAGDWVHVAAVFNGTSLILYIDGVNVASTTFSATTLVQTTDPLNISKRVGTDVYYFDGLIDEVRVYTSALTSQEINDVINSITLCSLTAVDHYQIEHDGNGLTCEAETVTIKTCADANCSILNTDAVSLNFQVDGVTQSSPTFSGSTTVNFNQITPATVTLSVANETITPDNALVCKNGASSSCDVVFADAGFRFLYGDAESTTIGNQVSGNDFADTVKLQAVESVNGVCTGIFTGNKEVELSQQNIAPGSTTGLSLKINGAGGTTIAKYPTYTPNITLNFGVDSKATIPAPVYLDAGQIRLHAKYNGGGVSLAGNSNDFWVSPKKLISKATKIVGGSNIDGNTNTSTTIYNAGQVFNFTVTAYNSLGTSVGNITENYIPNDIQLLLTRTGPTTGGVEGSFNYGNGTLLSDLTPVYQSVILANFNSGISSSSTASYTEVGLLGLDIQDINYGFTSNTIIGDAINIGRFTPDNFVQTVVEQGSLDAVYNQNTAFAYIGQTLVGDASKGAISYLVNPVVELTAKNEHGITTKNYTETGYNKLVASASFITVPLTDNSIKGIDADPLPLTADMYAGTVSHNGLVASLPSFGVSLNAGVLHYELADEDNFLYPRNENSEVNAQNNNIDFVIDAVNFIDSDGVAIITPANITDTVGIKIRFGRAVLDNSFGPETANLPQPLSVQYLDTNGNFVINDLDSCTNLTPNACTNYDASNITLSNGTLNESFTEVFAALGQLDEGETRAMILKATGVGNQGTVNVEYDVYSWLKYDWDWDGVAAKDFDTNPDAVATFGQFRGNDRIIYQREVNN